MGTLSQSFRGRNDPDISTRESCAASASKRFGAETNGRPVCSAIFAAMSSAYPSAVFNPVQPAIPPAPPGTKQARAGTKQRKLWLTLFLISSTLLLTLHHLSLFCYSATRRRIEQIYSIIGPYCNCTASIARNIENMVRYCAECGDWCTNRGFSRSQWMKGDGYSRCVNCVIPTLCGEKHFKCGANMVQHVESGYCKGCEGGDRARQQIYEFAQRQRKMQPYMNGTSLLTNGESDRGGVYPIFRTSVVSVRNRSASQAS